MMSTPREWNETKKLEHGIECPTRLSAATREHCVIKRNPLSHFDSVCRRSKWNTSFDVALYVICRHRLMSSPHARACECLRSLYRIFLSLRITSSTKKNKKDIWTHFRLIFIGSCGFVSHIDAPLHVNTMKYHKMAEKRVWVSYVHVKHGMDDVSWVREKIACNEANRRKTVIPSIDLFSQPTFCPSFFLFASVHTHIIYYTIGRQKTQTRSMVVWWRQQKQRQCLHIICEP